MSPEPTLLERLVAYSRGATPVPSPTPDPPPMPQPINPRTRYTAQNQAIIDAYVRHDPQGFIAQMAGEIGWKLPQ